MAKYWSNEDGTLGLLTYGEVKTLAYRHGYDLSEFHETLYEITEFQTEYESIAECFQHKDPNGEYMWVAKEFRCHEEPGAYGLTVPEAIAQLIRIAEEWRDYCTADADAAERLSMEKLIRRLQKLLDGARPAYISNLHRTATMLYEFGPDYPAEHREYWEIWRTLVNSKNAYGVTRDEILSIMNAHGI